MTAESFCGVPHVSRPQGTVASSHAQVDDSLERVLPALGDHGDEVTVVDPSGAEAAPELFLLGALAAGLQYQVRVTVVHHGDNLLPGKEL